MRLITKIYRFCEWVNEKADFLRSPLFWDSTGNIFRASFYQALTQTGIDLDTRKNRNITFHSWRHYFNTEMRSMNVPNAKLQMITGHSSIQMTDHYTHFNAEHMQDVVAVQKRLLG